jgi:hypothetical protein
MEHEKAVALSPTSSDSPVCLTTGDRVETISADTTKGDVVVELPDATEIRHVLVVNRTGKGYVEVRAAQVIHPDESTTLILGPGERALLHSFGSGWEMVR